jgi:ATP-binding cassette, subfamily G (WHITE), member 2, PDR
LDSVNALDFIKALRQRTSESGSVAIVTLYQASEQIYQLFDKVTVLYEGRQIYFGPTHEAKHYFTSLGFINPARSTTPEFLTSVTRPFDLRPRTREGIGHTPKTATEFAQVWKASPQHKSLIQEIEAYNITHPLGAGENLRKMRLELHGSEEKRSVYSRSC